jgi:hypothetical protein
MNEKSPSPKKIRLLTPLKLKLDGELTNAKKVPKN